MKKGFTIVEIVVAIGAASIVSALLISIVLMYNTSFRQSTKEYREYFYSTEALMFIENEVENSKSIRVYNNTIELNYYDEKIKNYIYLNNNNNLVIEYTKQSSTKTPDNIVNKVNSFDVLQKDSVIYVSIKLINGEKYERCMKINKEI